MKERINFHLLKLVFKALYSDAWPSYLKINEVAHTGLLRSKCREKIHTVLYIAFSFAKLTETFVHKKD